MAPQLLHPKPQRALAPRQVIWHSTVAAVLSFDEALVMRAMTATRASDWGSLEFLFRSREATADRRCVGCLLAEICNQPL